MSERRSGDEGSELRPERLGLRPVQLGPALRVPTDVARDPAWHLAEGGVGAGRVFYFESSDELREFIAALDATIDELRERHEARTEGPVSLLVYLTVFESVEADPRTETSPTPDR